MSKRHVVDPRQIPGIDMDYRPRSYFWAADLNISLPSNIAGEARRQFVRELIAGGKPVPDGFDAPVLDVEMRQAWGRLHPSNMGGEYLPPLRKGEVEIARISLKSTTADQISVRARRNGVRNAYRIVDEYPDDEMLYDVRPRTSKTPLSMLGIVALLDGATDQGGAVMSWVVSRLEDGKIPEGYEHFVSVESDFYPDLGRYYEARLDGLVGAS